jgi:hypothetical protein
MRNKSIAYRMATQPRLSLDRTTDISARDAVRVGNNIRPIPHSHRLAYLHLKTRSIQTMNPIRPLLRSAVFSRAAAGSTFRHVARRTLVTPTSPAQAKVSEVSVEQRVREDPGEFEEGHHVSGETAEGEGE